MAADTSDITLLADVLPAFREVAEYLAGDSDDAKAAQAAVNQDSQIATAFHATFYTSVYTIEVLLCDWSEHAYSASPSAQAAVVALLRTLELLVGELRPDSPTSFPKLRELQEDGRATHEHEDESALHYHIKTRLYVPKHDMREALELSLRECAAALDPDSLPSSVFAIAQEEKLIPQIKDLCMKVGLLGSLLKDQLECEACSQQHDAVFSFATPCMGPNAFRGCLMSFRSNAASDTWQFAKVEFLKVVHDTGPAAAVPICKTIAGSATEVHFKPCQKGFVESKVQYDGRRASATTLTHLSTWINDTEKRTYADVGEKDRLILALLLSYAYLYLEGTFWWPQDRSNAGVWFVDHLNDKVLRPFLQFSALEKKGSGFVLEKCINGARPSLPGFGKLILEIWLGKSISWSDTDMQLAELECQKSAIGPHIFRIARSCIEADPILKGAGRLRDSQAMSETFASHVVKCLQYVTKFAGIPPAKVLKLLDAQMQTDNRKVPDKAPVASQCPSALASSDDRAPAKGSISENASEWFEYLHNEVHSVLIKNPNNTSGIKVAIIDTGANFNRSQYKSFHRQHISDCRTWCDADNAAAGRSIMDAEGVIMAQDVAKDVHGTHCLSVLRKVAPNCTIFVAQVFEDPDDVKDKYPSDVQAERIAHAIEYASTVEQVDIISMSFGFCDAVPVIRSAIDRAAIRPSKPCLMFAAASNAAGSKGIAWPAWHDQVIGVHAMDGLGNKYPRNVSPQHPWKEIATLGCEVEAFIGPGQLGTQSGTSVATPTAAGIAALILGEVVLRKTQYLEWIAGDRELQTRIYDEKLHRLRTCGGMSKVLNSMSTCRDGYNYLRPWEILHKDYGHDCLRVEEIVKIVAPTQQLRVPSQKVSPLGQDQDEGRNE